MVIRIIKNIIRPFIKFRLRVAPTAEFAGEKPGRKNCAGRINVLDNAGLKIGKNFKFNGLLNVSKDAQVVIGDDCGFNNVNIYISGKSKVVFGEGTRISSGPLGVTSIFVQEGYLSTGYRVNMMCSVSIRFGASLSIGTYSSISYGTELFVDESISIGDYCLLSYDICIYDTDSHSLNWEKRRERIEAGYPVGTDETEKPNTKPVVIGNDVWIGKGATITKGAKIGDRCIIGLRTVVGGGEFEPDTVIITDKPRTIAKRNE